MRLFNQKVNGVKVWFILLSISFCLAVIAVLLDSPRLIKKIDLGQKETGSPTLETARIKIDGIIFNVLVADTKEERVKGLSGRTGLDARQGMLFVFPDNDQHSIWMKDMKFPIDIIWISENLRIVDIKRDASPESYPESFTNVWPARYVLELSAGSIDAFSLNGLSNIQIDTFSK
jgi:uncharacterized membrane protein (UPF0127 family)